MKKIQLILFLILALAIQLGAQRFPEALSPRTSNYVIKTYLDTEERMLRSTQQLIFVNPSADTIRTMPLHMYYNAFKSNQTEFNTGYGGIPRMVTDEEFKEGKWAWTEVTKVIDQYGNELNTSYIQPDTDNPADHTVLEIRLEQPVMPFDSIRLDMEWEARIPKAKARTGYSRDFYFMVQWYPKLGVYEPAGSRFAEKGAWNCHQYHPSTEYFGEFGTYEIELDVPKDYITGASGFELARKQEGERQKITYLAEDVIDFAWTASPKFNVIKDQWKETELRLLIMPEHECNNDRFLDAAKHSLDYFEEYLGKYPYPTLTIVSPPFHGLYSGAMEYPTLITAPTLCDLPEGIKTTETLTIHELTHQYFMQMVATNEQEEPWLDEGFTSFFEAKILDKYYPEGVLYFDYFDVQVSSTELRRGRYMSTNNPKVSPLAMNGFDAKDRSTRDVVYGKGAVMLFSLEGIVGEEMMQKILRSYFQKWKFKHPCRNDFVDVALEVVGKSSNEQLLADVDDFLQQGIYSTFECDYEVASIDNRVVAEAVGFLENNKEVVLPADDYDPPYLSRVVIYRNGELTLPQKVLVTFDDGNKELVRWDGKERLHELTFKGMRKVICAELDPYHENPLDNNLINNSLNLKQEKKGIWRYVVSFFTWLQNVMVSVGGLV